MIKTDSDPLNKLAMIINANSHLLDKTTVKELLNIYNELVDEYILFEQEVAFNEKLIRENESLKLQYFIQ